MADVHEDPREGPLHPRFVPQLIGHQFEEGQFIRAVLSGKLHHAWLLTGAEGIGKASLAYQMAGYILHGGASAGDTNLTIPDDAKTKSWMMAQSHPDLFVLERALNDSKPRRLKQEISVNDARKLTEFFGRTAGGGGWRVAIVDAADDLNTESANALLKLIEEPPNNCLLLLVCHAPGRLLRTIRSRCTRLAVSALSETDVLHILQTQYSDGDKIDVAALSRAAQLSAGSPGRARMLIDSHGAKAFMAYCGITKLSPQVLFEFSNRFVGKTLTGDDFRVFCELLLNWLGRSAIENAANRAGPALAAAHEEISHSIRRTNALNLDRRQAVIEAVTLIDHAMRAA